MITFVNMLLLLTLYLLEVHFWGNDVALYTLSAMSFIFAILFTYNMRFYDNFMEKVFTRYYRRMNQKGEKYKAKTKRIYIISFYLLSFIFFLNGEIAWKYNHNMGSQSVNYLYAGGIAVCFIIILYFIDDYIFKKKKELR